MCADSLTNITTTGSRHETGLEIAVTGMAGRFPGANDIPSFWDNLKKGVESITFFSDTQLLDAGVDPGELEHSDYVKAKGVLDDIESFDAAFFGLSPHEVAVMDPQVRIFHECAWTALEDAGYDPASYGGLVGIYSGAAANLGWEVLAVLSGRARMLGDFHSWHLFDKDFLSTRVAYNLNLRGPAINVQTSCSTALVAVHLACQALLSGECDIALAGGVSVRIPSREGYLYREGLIMSRDGHCCAFDAKSGGTVLGEGCGIVVLKQLAYAREDGDHIYAVVKGSAVNNDGRVKAGYTSPGVEGQADVIRAAFQAADVEPSSISYVETHGTGTRLGDPTEIEALTRAFNSSKKNTCAIGSVKTNIGHLDCAAGAAGLIKAVLALEHRLIPASLHFDTPNPLIDFQNSPFFVNRRLSSWPGQVVPLRAGVSSFGIGGTNAHMILEEAPPPAVCDGDVRPREWQLLLLSARTPDALEQATKNMANYLKDHAAGLEGVGLADIAYTLQTGRKAFQHRRAVLCSTMKEAEYLLTSRDNPGSPLSMYTSFCPEPYYPFLFMFPGQGSQYAGMGKDLYRSEAVFREKIDRCFDLLESLAGIPVNRLKEAIFPDGAEPGESSINQTYLAQPLLFVFEYAVARMLMAWGIRPDALMGHSLGEFTAACISGVFSLEDALVLVAKRGRLMQDLPPGIMLGVQLPPERIMAYIDEGASLSAVNTPDRCVISGPPDVMERVERRLNQSGIPVRTLHTSHAFHSDMMEPIVDKFAAIVGGMTMEKPGIPFISSVTGTWIRESEVRDPMYWATQMKRPVQMAAGIGGLLMESSPLMVEAGPGRTLCSFVRGNPHFQARHAVVDLVRHPNVRIDDRKYLVHQLGQLWLHGVTPDWEGYYIGQHRKRVPLPTYPFERQRFPVEGIEMLGKLRRGADIQAILSNPPPRESTGAVDGPQDPAPRSNAPVDANPRPFLSTSYHPPENHLQRQLVRIWEDFLGVRPVGVHDDFFQLGGDSLKAVSFVNRIHSDLGFPVSLPMIFNSPTVHMLAHTIGELGGHNDLALERAEEKEYYPLSPPQQRVYIQYRLDENSLGYNMPHTAVLEGSPDRARLERVFKQLVQRHDSLRTSFITVNGEPVQRIRKTADFELVYIESIETGTPEFVRDCIRPFDLAQAPLLRVFLARENHRRFLLVVDLHHIIADGTSNGILIKEFAQLYANEGSGENTTAEPVFSYKDFCQWRKRRFHGKCRELESQKTFWLNELSGDIPRLQLPADFPRPGVDVFEGKTIPFQLDERRTGLLNTLASESGATLYMVLLSMFNILLSRISGQEDILIGSAASGRNRAGLENIIGMFVNTMVLRNFPDTGKNFRQFLDDVRERLLNALENQDYPFEQLVEHVVLERDPTRHPLFDVMFHLRPVDYGEFRLPGLVIKPFPYDLGAAKFDLTLEAATRGSEPLIFWMHYNTQVFKQDTVERFISQYLDIITAVLAEPNVLLKDLDLSLEEDRDQLLTVSPDQLENE